MMTREEELAWAAGLYEGEGSISIARSCLHLSVSMVDREPVARLHRIMGVGYLRGPYDNGPGRQPFWRWSVNRRLEVDTAIDRLSPWLSSRRQEQLRSAQRDLPIIRKTPRYIAYARAKQKWHAYTPSPLRTLGYFDTEEEALLAVAEHLKGAF